jgi:hypothetical protein
MAATSGTFNRLELARGCQLGSYEYRRKKREPTFVGSLRIVYNNSLLDGLDLRRDEFHLAVVTFFHGAGGFDLLAIRDFADVFVEALGHVIVGDRDLTSLAVASGLFDDGLARVALFQAALGALGGAGDGAFFGGFFSGKGIATQANDSEGGNCND